MLGKLDRFLELSYDYAHGDGLSDEQEVEYESLKKEINHSIKIQELVKEKYKESQAWARDWSGDVEPDPSDIIDTDDAQEYKLYMTLKSLVQESEK